MEHLFKQWLIYVKHMYLHKPLTIKIYARNGNDFIRRWGKQDSISTEDVEAFIVEHVNLGLSNATINQKLAVLKVFLTWAENHKKIKERPVVDLLRVPKLKVVKSLNSEEVDKLLTASSGSPVERGVWIALMAGLRREEIRFLEYKDIDLEKKVIYIRAKEGFSPKSYSERIIPITENLASRFQTRSKYRWVVHSKGRQASTPFLERHLRSVMISAGIYELGMPTWHRLRHTFASKFIEAGGDIQSLKDLMGHCSIQTTQTYMHSNPLRQRSIIEGMNIL